MLTWWKSEVNRSFLLCLAAICDTLSRPCARHVTNPSFEALCQIAGVLCKSTTTSPSIYWSPTRGLAIWSKAEPPRSGAMQSFSLRDVEPIRGVRGVVVISGDHCAAYRPAARPQGGRCAASADESGCLPGQGARRRMAGHPAAAPARTHRRCARYGRGASSCSVAAGR